MRHTQTAAALRLRVADEAWIAAALLQREFPEREDFSVQEIVSRARKEKMTRSLRAGVEQHIVYHGVANRPPNPGRHRMLFATARGRRRLYRPGDPIHPDRTGKVTPEAAAIPEQYRYLLDWYRGEYAAAAQPEWLGSLAKMIGAGKEIFAGQDPDQYVKRLREGWA